MTVNHRVAGSSPAWGASFCRNLNLGSIAWRLPSVAEYESLTGLKILKIKKGHYWTREEDDWEDAPLIVSIYIYKNGVVKEMLFHPNVVI